MRILILFLSLALVGCASSQKPKLRGNLFAELTPGHRVEIKYRSRGDFHSIAYDFQFQRAEQSTSVRISVRDWIPKSPKLKPPRLLGTITLSAQDIAGLDRLIRFYRTHPAYLCTSGDQITIEHFRPMTGDTAIATESYWDLSCQVNDVPGVLTLPDLAGRLNPLHQ
jgi:hypothetical protein